MTTTEQKQQQSTYPTKTSSQHFVTGLWPCFPVWVSEDKCMLYVYVCFLQRLGITTTLQSQFSIGLDQSIYHIDLTSIHNKCLSVKQYGIRLLLLFPFKSCIHSLKVDTNSFWTRPDTPDYSGGLSQIIQYLKCTLWVIPVSNKSTLPLLW